MVENLENINQLKQKVKKSSIIIFKAPEFKKKKEIRIGAKGKHKN